MICFEFLLLILIIYRIRFGAFHHDYLGFEQSTAVKGIFAFIIFLSHSRDYYSLSDGIGDIVFRKFLSTIDQTMVVMYFFYSGYGVMESYKHKQGYAVKFFKNRIIKTLIHFDMAVVLYMILNLFLGKRYSLVGNLLSLTGWVSIGNSNWFICVILILYLLTVVAFAAVGIQRKNEKAVCTAVLFLSVLLWIGLAYIGKSAYWYNTFLAYPAGMVFSLFKDRIDLNMKKNQSWLLSMALILILIAVCYKFRGNAVTYSVFSLLVSLLVVMTTMKVKMNNAYLQFLGKYSFSIYILQRLPMIVLHYVGITSPVLFTLMSLCIVLILAFYFEKLLKAVDRRFFSN